MAVLSPAGQGGLRRLVMVCWAGRYARGQGLSDSTCLLFILACGIQIGVTVCAPTMTHPHIQPVSFCVQASWARQAAGARGLQAWTVHTVQAPAGRLLLICTAKMPHPHQLRLQTGCLFKPAAQLAWHARTLGHPSVPRTGPTVWRRACGSEHHCAGGAQG